MASARRHAAVATLLAATASVPTEALPLSLRPSGATFTGTVYVQRLTTRGGTAVSTASVAFLRGSTTRSETSAADGSYTVRGLGVGTWTISASHHAYSGYTVNPSTVLSNGIGAQTQDIYLCEPGILRCGPPTAVLSTTSASGLTLSIPNFVDFICARSDWIPISHDEFPYAWRWCQNRSLVIGLADANTTKYVFGIHIEVDGVIHGTPYGDDWLPLLIVAPRTDGTHPVVSRNGALSLAVQGSSEHGCDTLGYDEVEISITPQVISSGLKIEIDIDGVVYMGFPPEGNIMVWESSGTPTLLDAEAMSVDGSSDEFSAISGLIQWGTSLNSLMVVAHNDIPWFQVQGHTDLIEIDLDHSCEATPLPDRPRMSLYTWVL